MRLKFEIKIHYREFHKKNNVRVSYSHKLRPFYKRRVEAFIVTRDIACGYYIKTKYSNMS